MKPSKIYAEVVDGATLDQYYTALKLDYVVQGALMPDAHLGYGLPIGGVMATEGMIVPAWVGYDIGCGMCAIKTNITKPALSQYSERIYNQIYKDIPVGTNMHEYPSGIHSLNIKNLSEIGLDAFNSRGGFNALGTLGSGNHFIELGADSSDIVWVIIHSGSRGVGHGTAQRYMKLASESDKAKEGHYPLAVDQPLGQSYINDMNWMLEFALQNRMAMILSVERILANIYGQNVFNWDGLINRNHNHAELKDGRWIHRKGATHADKGMMGVIPANMRDGAFIVRGKGNPESLFSSSHGAGRVMSRREAKENVSLEDFEASMKNVVAKVGQSTLDESPFAYKNIWDVMEAQKDLVEVVEYVTPIINVKG
jgi:tRNA-splicing ligase RtcB